MPHATAKLAAARAALAYLTHKYDGEAWHIGIGTGSTVNAFIDVLAESDAYTSVDMGTVVSSSKATMELLVARGIRVSEANQVTNLDVYIDGADRITSRGYMLKGGGGALFGEKLVAQLAAEFVCIAEEKKRVAILGDFPVVVEVVPRASSYVARKLVGLGGTPELREGFVTDQGNRVLDTYNLDLSDPLSMEQAINEITGVLDNGIFARTRATVAFLGQEHEAKRYDMA